MNLAELRSEARFRLKDEAKPYFWPNDWLEKKINEAVNEACIRARLIEDASSQASSIDITPDQKRYALHESVFDVLSCALASRPDDPLTGWTLTDNELVFDRFPKADDVLLMVVQRTPIEPMADDGDSPEIRTHHHVHLVDWVEHVAYGVKDADSFDPNASARALSIFEQAFGVRPSASVQRKFRQKTARVVRMNPF